MSISILDSEIYGSSWVSAAVSEIFSESHRLELMLVVLSQLAISQADCDLIPKDIAHEISKTLQTTKLDSSELKKAYLKTGHSMAGLIEVLKTKIKAPASHYVYFGATVQDITDTVQALQLQKAWRIIFDDLMAIEKHFLHLTKAHKETAILGRTHGQDGAPMTFGVKTAIWSWETRSALEKMKLQYRNICHGQLAGSIGVLSQYGSRANELRQNFLNSLGLVDPKMPWINSRSHLTEFTSLLALICTQLEKACNEVYNLQRSEIAELSESWGENSIGSITMPHKRNPETSEQIGTLARIVRHQHGMMLESIVHEHERDGKSWKIEWYVIPEILCLSAKAISLSRQIFSSIEVHPNRMKENLIATNGFAFSEKLLELLCSIMPPQEARLKVQAIIKKAISENQDLTDEIKKDPILMKLWPTVDPLTHWGQSHSICEFVLQSEPKNQDADLKFLQFNMDFRDGN